ncbi:MAG: hypothetical protein H7Y06_09005 [Opitutaceae bacterium]|nr:hypothetical protein [Opitutaceae bacterium]
MLAPPERTATVTTPSQPRKRTDSDRLHPSRAPVVAAEKVPVKSASINRIEQREMPSQFRNVSTAPTTSPTERTLGNRRPQTISSPAQAAQSAMIVSRPTPRTVTPTTTQPVASPRNERSSTSFGARPSMQPVPSRPPERTTSPVSQSSSSMSVESEASDRGLSRNRNWR